MIVEEIFYAVKCNRCGELHNDGEHSFWNDNSTAIENAMESEWVEITGKHYCPKCYDYNDEKEEYIIRPEYPQHLKTLISFINKITDFSNTDVSETDKYFIVTAGSYRSNKLMPFEENYIKELLGHNFISIEHKKHDRYTRFDFIVKMSKK